jgi:putative hydrolase of the HAD superfamily
MRRVVVFDLDDTLFPERQYVLSGLRAVDMWLKDAHGLIGFYDHAHALFNAGQRGDIFDLALSRLGCPGDKALIRTLVKIYREHSPILSLYEDARWAIDVFGARGPLGLLSDGYLIAQQHKLAALHIADAFQAVVFSDSLGRDSWKPSPRPYQRIMELIPGVPSDFVYVADNPRKDFVTARRLGWGTIQVARREAVYHGGEEAPDCQADAVITSLFALEKM